VALSQTYINTVLTRGTPAQRVRLAQLGYISVPVPNYKALADAFMLNPSAATAAAIYAPYEQAAMRLATFSNPALKAHRSTSDQINARHAFAQYQKALGIVGADRASVFRAMANRPEYTDIVKRPDFKQFIAQAHKSDPWLLAALLAGGVVIGTIGFAAAGASVTPTVAPAVKVVKAVTSKINTVQKAVQPVQQVVTPVQQAQSAIASVKEAAAPVVDAVGKVGGTALNVAKTAMGIKSTIGLSKMPDVPQQTQEQMVVDTAGTVAKNTAGGPILAALAALAYIALS